MPVLASFDPANYNSTTGTGYTLGQDYSNGDGNIYRFFLTTDAVNITVGMVVEWASTTAFTVTVDRAGGSSLGRIPAGVAMGGVTAGRYGFFLVRGRHTAIRENAGGGAGAITAAGQKAIPHATTDGDAKIATAYTDNWFAVSLAATSGNVFPAEVRI